MGHECWGRDLTLGQPLSICILLGRGALQTERAFRWGKVDVEGKSSLYTNLCTLVDKQAWFEVDPKLHKVRAWWDQPSYMFFSANWSRKEYTHLSLALAVACIHTFECFPVISCFLFRLIHSGCFTNTSFMCAKRIEVRGGMLSVSFSQVLASYRARRFYLPRIYFSTQSLSFEVLGNGRCMTESMLCSKPALNWRVL